MRQEALFGAPLLTGAALAGCGPDFDHLELAQRTSPPSATTLASDSVSIPVGIAVAVNPIPRDDSNERVEKVMVDLVSSDLGVLGIDPDVDDGFVIYGVSEGSATISMFLDGDSVGTVPATVTKP